MTNKRIHRRTLLQLFGLASFTPMLPVPQLPKGKVAVAKPGESRFAFSDKLQAWLSPSKVTAEDSGGSLSVMELHVYPQTGPTLHVHHREDEWYYVLAGQFIFHAGEEKFDLVAGSSIWLPRDIPHVWANTSNSEGKLILVCQPGGFEKFFEELGRTMAEMPSGSPAAEQMKAVMAKYGMEMLGPPLLKPLRQHS